MLDGNTIDRLINWKFSTAASMLLNASFDSTPRERDIIRALSRSFGDCGWFDGAMGEIVGASVTALADGHFA
jgi:hypothetical protein